MAPSKPRRLPSETFTLALDGGALPDGTMAVQEIAVSVTHEPGTRKVQDLIFVSRGKIGQGLDHMLADLGICVSRIIQDRDPITGEFLNG